MQEDLVDLQSGAQGERVEQLQHDLIALDLPPRGGADGVLGGRTLAKVDAWRIRCGQKPLALTISASTIAAIHAAAEHRRQVPPPPDPPEPGQLALGAWCDRSGLYDPDDMIELAVGLVDAVSLFVHGLDHARGPTFGSFMPLDRIESISQRYADAALQVHWTTWLSKHRPWLKSFRSTLLEHVRSSVVTGLHLDLEGPFGGASDDQVVYAADVVADGLQGTGITVYVTDYASIQKASVKFIRALAAAGVRVVLVPQAYSVSYTNYGGHKITAPGTYHWPGVTQRACMIDRRWGQLLELGDQVDVEMGIAAYKQSFEGLTPAQSMAMQLDGAREYSSRRVWMWKLEMVRRVRSAVLGWKAAARGVV